MKNPSLAILILNKDCRVVACAYDKDAVTGKGVQPFTQFKTFDTDLKVGDMVIVPTNTRFGFTSVRVEEIDVEWSPEETKVIDWIADKLDLVEYEKDIALEKDGLKIISQADKRKKREELTASVTEHLNAAEKEKLLVTQQKPAE